MSNVKDKNGEPVKEGDHVYTPIRGGRHEGNVEKVVMDDIAAADEDVKNPPKVSTARKLWYIGLAAEERNDANRFGPRLCLLIRMESR